MQLSLIVKTMILCEQKKNIIICQIAKLKLHSQMKCDCSIALIFVNYFLRCHGAAQFFFFCSVSWLLCIIISNFTGEGPKITKRGKFSQRQKELQVIVGTSVRRDTYVPAAKIDK